MNENLIVILEDEGVVTSTFRRISSHKKQKLYNTALKAFAADVFDRVALDRVANDSGISKGSLFQYFTNKENLLAFVCEIFIDEYQIYWDNYFKQERVVRVRDRIKGFFFETIDFFQTNENDRDYYMIMHYGNGKKLGGRFVRRISEIHQEHFADIISRGRETGQIRRDINITTIARLLTIVFDGLIRNLFSKANSKIDIDSEIDKTVSIIFDGLVK